MILFADTKELNANHVFYSNSYEGVAIEQTRDGPVMLQHSGRIVIDTSSWNKFSRQMHVYVDPLSHSEAKAPTDDSDNDDDDASEASWGGDSDDDTVPANAGGQGLGTPKPPSLTDYERMLCNSIVRGYSLRMKKWRKF